MRSEMVFAQQQTLWRQLADAIKFWMIVVVAIMLAFAVGYTLAEGDAKSGTNQHGSVQNEPSVTREA